MIHKKSIGKIKKNKILKRKRKMLNSIVIVGNINKRKKIPFEVITSKKQNNPVGWAK